MIYVFDLDNTLIQRNDAMLRCIEAQFSMVLDQQQKKAIRQRDEAGYSPRLGFCQWLKQYLNLPDTAVQIWDTIRKHIGRYVTVQPSTLSILQRLGQQHELAILTNGGTENQLNKIRHAGLDRLIPQERIFISEAMGCSKPDEQAFRHVEQYFQKKSDFCMIGDHLENDIYGALYAGWQAIYLNPKGIIIPNIKSIQSLEKLVIGY